MQPFCRSAQVMARELGWDELKMDREIDEVRAVYMARG